MKVNTPLASKITSQKVLYENIKMCIYRTPHSKFYNLLYIPQIKEACKNCGYLDWCVEKPLEDLYAEGVLSWMDHRTTIRARGHKTVMIFTCKIINENKVFEIKGKAITKKKYLKT